MNSSELLARLAPESSLAGFLSVALVEVEGPSLAAAGSADGVDVIVIASGEGIAMWEGRHGRAMRRESTRWSQVRFAMVSMHSKDQNTIAVATVRLELEVPAVTLQTTGFLIRALRELVRVIEERVDESFGPGRNRALRFLDGPAEGERYGVDGPLPQVILASALGETGGHYRIAGASPLGRNYRWRDDVTELDSSAVAEKEAADDPDASERRDPSLPAGRSSIIDFAGQMLRLTYEAAYLAATCAPAGDGA
jgi:hypothetical protein